MARRPVDPVDTIWLNMDRADNLMVIESLMMLDGPVDRDRFKATVEHRILDRFPVFRQRPVPSRLPMVAPHWEDDPDFDLVRHFVHARLQAHPGLHVYHYAAYEVAAIKRLMGEHATRDRPSAGRFRTPQSPRILRDERQSEPNIFPRRPIAPWMARRNRPGVPIHKQKQHVCGWALGSG